MQCSNLATCSQSSEDGNQIIAPGGQTPSVLENVQSDGEKREDGTRTSHSSRSSQAPRESVVIGDGSAPIHSKHQQLNATDAEQRYHLEKDGNPPPNPRKGSRIIISFAPADADNPYNWPTRKKIFVLFVGIVSVINSTLGSSLPAGATSFLAHDFHVANQAETVLPISLFLVGYVFGPLVFAPLSESYGRRIVMISTFALFTIFTLACALSPNWPTFLVFRLLSGITASSAIAIVGGLFADIYDDPVTRGRALSFFMAATACGPQLAPIISGYVSVVTWRWTFWIGLIIAGISLAFLCLMQETYGPAILKRRARQMRKETGNPNIFAPIELEKKGARQLITVTLTRPVRMILFEAIVLFTCVYLSIAYAVFYLFFEAYPLIFQGIYGFNTGTAGLPFLAIGVGALLSVAIFLYWDVVLMRAKKANAAWTEIEEYRRLPLAAIGGPLYVISLFWLGWTARSDIHWIVPILSGIPFGLGFMLIFMALLNYLTDAYEIFAASALAATSATRSVFGAVLPLAARPMYNTLGIAWASSLLGFVSLFMSIIPFVFIKYGGRLRANSTFCQELLQKKKAYKEEQALEESIASAPVNEKTSGEVAKQGSKEQV